MNDSSASTSLDDFLNLDLVAATGGLDVNPSASATATDFHDLFSPRLSDASPSSSATFLPPNTPPQPMQGQTVLDALNPNHAVFNDLYNTYIEPLNRVAFAKPSTSSGGLVDGAFAFQDLFASYASNPTFDLFPPAPSSDSTPATSTTTPSAPLALPFTIDPQLVATPAPSQPSPLLSSATPDNEAIPAATVNSTTPASNLASSSKAITPSAPTSSVAPPKFSSIPRASTESVIDEDDSEDDEDEDEDDLPIAAVKNKSRTKKSMTAGGVAKRTQVTSCVVRAPDSNDPDDWRPTAEEYKKLSSKEKRQLRNKISARNFRVRRKEYITTLEGQISDRDKLISAIREELGAQKTENAELRQEIDNLKKAMLDGRHPLPSGLPPPSATSSMSPDDPPTTTTTRRTTSTPLTKANPNKDVGGSGSFWGGAIGGLGGVTSVHRMVVPELSVLAGKGPRNWGLPLSTATLGTLPGHGSFNSARSAAQDNINPNLNSRSPVSTTSASSEGGESSPSPPASSGSSSDSPIHTPPQSPPLNLISSFVPTTAQQQQQQQQQQLWNGFGDINPFTIKTLDSYRMQLWSKMAAAGHVPPAQPQQQQQQALFNTYAANGTSNLTGHLRPAFFDTPEASAPAAPSGSTNKKQNSSLSALLAGKTAANLAASSPSPSTSYPTPPTSPNTTLPGASSPQQVAAAAAAASLVSRMSSAFRDAFAQPPSSSASSPANRQWDMEKVKKVLEGKAVLKVVDVDAHHQHGLPTAAATTSAMLKKSPLLRAKSVDPSLEEKMSRLSLNMSTGLTREDREVDSMLLAAPSAMKTSAFKTLLK